jgi:hypothetical protein
VYVCVCVVILCHDDGEPIRPQLELSHAFRSRVTTTIRHLDVPLEEGQWICIRANVSSGIGLGSRIYYEANGSGFLRRWRARDIGEAEKEVVMVREEGLYAFAAQVGVEI